METTAGFVRAYHLTSAEHAISSIALRRLKVARFSEVNDPFELFGLSLHEGHLRKAAHAWKDSLDSKTGLLSFSSRWESPVLWSHYASGHKGICLGFELKEKDVQAVRYRDKRLRSVIGSGDDPAAMSEKFPDLLRRTKSREWEYEQELRVFVQLSRARKEHGLYFWPFSVRMRLVEVILGPLCEVSLDSVRSLVSATSPTATVLKARLAFRSFRVVPDGRSLP